MDGRDITLYSAVMKSQGVTADVMIQNALTREYWSNGGKESNRHELITEGIGVRPGMK